MPALGEEFRSAREARGLTLSDVAEQIHIRSVYLGAIENEDWPQIGAPVYVRGFIRTYARFLGLDPEAAVDRFNATAPAERAAAPASIPSQVGVGSSVAAGPSPLAWIVTVAALALVAFVGYQWWGYSHAPRQVAQSSSVASPQPGTAAPLSSTPEPAVSAAATALPSPSPRPSATPGPAHRLDLALTQRSWLRATVDGNTVMEGLYPAGTRKTFTGTSIDLRVGNAGGVTVSVNGAPAKLLGKDGDVVEQNYKL